MGIEKIKDNFRSLLDNKLTKLKMPHKVAILVAACAIPIIAFSVLFYSPQTKEIKGLEASKQSLEAEIQKAEKAAKELEKHKAEMEETKLKFRAASRLLPQKKEIPSLLTNISGQGTSSGLDFLSFTPRSEGVKEFYAEIPVDIVVRGTYHNVGTFLDKISKLPRIVTVSDLNVGAPVREDGEMMLNTRFKLVTYRFIEPTVTQ